MQVLVIGFEDPRFDGEILEQLRQLREQDIVRLVDLVVVAKDRDGNLSTLTTGELSTTQAAELGALAGALTGVDEAAPAPGGAEDDLADDDVWYVADVIRPGTAAAVAVLEHRWALPLREAIERAGGSAVADAWLHPSDLAAVAQHVPANATPAA
jgi:uncharacterized membrane protein